jgi:hypothetical protein
MRRSLRRQNIVSRQARDRIALSGPHADAGCC